MTAVQASLAICFFASIPDRATEIININSGHCLDIGGHYTGFEPDLLNSFFLWTAVKTERKRY